jgi:DNA modification methylase
MFTPTLHHGDTIHYARSLPAESFDLVLADPPYFDVLKNVAWDSPDRNDRKFTKDWLKEISRLLKPGGSVLVYGSPERLLLHRIALILADECGLELRQTLAWTYSQGGGARVSTMTKYAVQHENVLWLSKPGGKHVYNAFRGTGLYTEQEREVAKKKGKGRVTDESLDRGRNC